MKLERLWNCMQHRDKIIIDKVIAEIDIGELIKNVSDDTRKDHPDIPWKAIAGMRDIAAHKYQTLRMEDVYNTVCADFPILKEQLNKLIKVSKSCQTSNS